MSPSLNILICTILAALIAPCNAMCPHCGQETGSTSICQFCKKLYLDSNTASGSQFDEVGDDVATPTQRVYDYNTFVPIASRISGASAVPFIITDGVNVKAITKMLNAAPLLNSNGQKVNREKCAEYCVKSFDEEVAFPSLKLLDLDGLHQLAYVNGFTCLTESSIRAEVITSSIVQKLQSGQFVFQLALKSEKKGQTFKKTYVLFYDSERKVFKQYRYSQGQLILDATYHSESSVKYAIEVSVTNVPEDQSNHYFTSAADPE